MFFVSKHGLAIFCLFPLLEGRCRSSVLLWVLVPLTQWWSVRSLLIMEAGDKRKPKKKETKAKDSTFVWEEDKVELLLMRTALPIAKIYPPFWFRRQLPSKQKEMSCYRFWQRECTWTRSNVHRLVKPSLNSLETVAEKIRIHAKKIRIRNLRFQKIDFRERFRKAPFWGPERFQKAPNSCGYVWPFLYVVPSRSIAQ